MGRKKESEERKERQLKEKERDGRKYAETK